MGKFVVKYTPSGQPRFTLKAGNGQVIATSQVYKTLATCKAGINSIIANAPAAEIEDQTVENFEAKKNPKFEIYTDKAGEIRFRLKAKNGQIIASSEGYKSMKSCLNGIESVKKNAPEAEIELPDMSSAAANLQKPVTKKRVNKLKNYEVAK